MFERFTRWWFFRRVRTALALHTRGEVRRDGLRVAQCRSALQIKWRARKIHPWHRALPESQTNELFAEQCLADTSAAIERLFRELPEIELLDFTVIDPTSSAPILRGSIERSEVAVPKNISPGMKLKRLGVNYPLNNWHFEPLA